MWGGLLQIDKEAGRERETDRQTNSERKRETGGRIKRENELKCNAMDKYSMKEQEKKL